MNTQQQNSRMLELDGMLKDQYKAIQAAQGKMGTLLQEIAPLAATAQVGQVIVKKTGAHANKRMRVIKLVAEFEYGRVTVTHICIVLRKDGTDSDTHSAVRSYDGIEVQS